MRGVFAESFIDQTLQRFQEGDSLANKMLCGLLSADLALQARWFDS
jgi:hypothetical protein